MIVSSFFPVKEGFSRKCDFNTEDGYKTQSKALTDRFGTGSTTAITDPAGRRSVARLLSTFPTDDTKDSGKDFLPGINGIPESDRCLLNFYAIGCRFTGFMGPTDGNGYFDPGIAVQTAVNAGCRVFVLEISDLHSCSGNAHFPRIVVRDVQGKSLIKSSSDCYPCNTLAHSNIMDVCDKINTYAFGDSCQNRDDPVILVLYFLDAQPGPFNSKRTLDYYSAVAKCMKPLRDKCLINELTGNYDRQRQQSTLLQHKITDYNGKVLIFSNANTDGFRDTNAPTYDAMEDLDFIINLRLNYTLTTQLGITELNGNGNGSLQAVEDYLLIPSNNQQAAITQATNNWTIALSSSNPMKTVSSGNYATLTQTYGVHCVPLLLFDMSTDPTQDNSYMYKVSKSTSKHYSFIPKPTDLRYHPTTVTGTQIPNITNANGGILPTPVIPGLSNNKF
jgi:hypothetical protein